MKRHQSEIYQKTIQMMISYYESFISVRGLENWVLGYPFCQDWNRSLLGSMVPGSHKVHNHKWAPDLLYPTAIRTFAVPEAGTGQ